MIGRVQSFDYGNNSARRAGRSITRTVAAGAVVAAGLALGAKYGKFTVTDKTNKHLAKIFPYLEKAGNFINTKAATVVKKLHLEKPINTVSNAAKTVFGKVGDFFKGIIGTVSGFFKK